MNNNELIRPLLHTTVAEELHPSYGLGRPYSQDFCQSVMFMRLNNPDELLSPHIIEQQQAKTFPSKRTINHWIRHLNQLGHFRPYRMTGNKRAEREIRNEDLVDLSLYRAVLPKAFLYEVRVHLFNTNPEINQHPTTTHQHTLPCSYNPSKHHPPLNKTSTPSLPHQHTLQMSRSKPKPETFTQYSIPIPSFNTSPTNLPFKLPSHIQHPPEPFENIDVWSYHSLPILQEHPDHKFPTYSIYSSLSPHVPTSQQSYQTHLSFLQQPSQPSQSSQPSILQHIPTPPTANLQPQQPQSLLTPMPQTQSHNSQIPPTTQPPLHQSQTDNFAQQCFNSIQQTSIAIQQGFALQSEFLSKFIQLQQEQNTAMHNMIANINSTLQQLVHNQTTYPQPNPPSIIHTNHPQQQNLPTNSLHRTTQITSNQNRTHQIMP